ncbi:uncharacterized protein LOC111249503 isoform X1 [Varroa destructor]|uniref:Uncharacterized protein n=2 Tax=Varroa destructor TaxID=109461 RepID=A0A7M7K1N3_VARDE|nr:uncharacterized protein LOC111249503 isoform X1 [Varroa destructor]XP_022659171.1 uncharacterized protein LOC111249503 isoform X1 [Varroa destructor]XP_022659172.1 uncharacterized protein LOC111249503 isoform X1 [Varroa destructor]XP_022659173.1 uncharacterized protein LOC111249503 isoform X1 [Varroa destructor]XP_022659175.1 uncharacterized protein LOC111249503 isoform X1 [Varroa destructor]XP_022659176.1 uncharacterized protein LOC111249503 isoform X1 [Varroa destructor]XP_022659177.1 un
MGNIWSSQSNQSAHLNNFNGSFVTDTGVMLEREPSAEQLTQLREENTCLKKTTNYQEDTIRQLKTKLARVIALAKRTASSDVQTVSQLRYHEDSLRQLPNGTLTPQAIGGGGGGGRERKIVSAAGIGGGTSSGPTSFQVGGVALSGAAPFAGGNNPRPQSSLIISRARSATRGRMGAASATARSRSRTANNSGIDGVSLGLLEEAHNEICALKAEVKRREEEVREWETVAQKLNCELSSERKLRSEAEQEVSRTRVGLVKAHKEIQIKETQVEALEAEMEACRLTREKVDTQNAKLLELEQAMAKKESQESLLQELQQRIGELERERDIVEDSNRKLVRQSEELKERMAAQEQRSSTAGEGLATGDSATHDSIVHASTDEDLGGSALLQDMLLQLQDKFENLERHIEKVVEDARRSRSKSSKRHSKESSRESQANGSTGRNLDRERRRERPSGLKAKSDGVRTVRDQKDGFRSNSDPRNTYELNGIYSTDNPRPTMQADNLRHQQRHHYQEPKQRLPSGSALSNGSSVPLPKPRRRLLIQQQQSSVEESTSSLREGPDNMDHQDNSMLGNAGLNHDDSDSGSSRLHPRRAGTAVGYQRAALVKNEATQTSRSSEQQSSFMSPSGPFSALHHHGPSRLKQTTKILSSDDSVSEMTELSLADSSAPHFEIHIDKAHFSVAEGISLLALAKRNVVVTWELADFEVQSTPVGHLCKENEELVFNCTARYILEEERQLAGANLHLQVVTADGEVLGECVIDVNELQQVLREPRKKRAHSANLGRDRVVVGTLELWLRYIPRPD